VNRGSRSRASTRRRTPSRRGDDARRLRSTHLLKGRSWRWGRASRKRGAADVASAPSSPVHLTRARAHRADRGAGALFSAWAVVLGAAEPPPSTRWWRSSWTGSARRGGSTAVLSAARGDGRHGGARSEREILAAARTGGGQRAIVATYDLAHEPDARAHRGERRGAVVPDQPARDHAGWGAAGRMLIGMLEGRLPARRRLAELPMVLGGGLTTTSCRRCSGVPADEVDRARPARARRVREHVPP